jgi:hypothetical protein
MLQVVAAQHAEYSGVSEEQKAARPHGSQLTLREAPVTWVRERRFGGSALGKP